MKYTSAFASTPAAIVGKPPHNTIVGDSKLNNNIIDHPRLAMAEPEHTDHAEHTEPLPLLDDNDNPSNTPLDLLLNAISGSGGYTFPGADGDAHGAGDGDGDGDGDGEGGDVTVAPEGNAAISAFIEADHHATTGEAGKDGAESRQQNKITRTLREHFATRGGAFSTIEVWHPKTGQKSYGKERR